MEYLMEYGFDAEDISDIENMNYPYVIDNLKLNKQELKSIISYLLEIGLERSTIKEIFMYQITLFFKTKEEIQTSFDEYEIDSIVKSLNYDANNVELIDFI